MVGGVGGPTVEDGRGRMEMWLKQGLGTVLRLQKHKAQLYRGALSPENELSRRAALKRSIMHNHKHTHNQTHTAICIPATCIHQAPVIILQSFKADPLTAGKWFPYVHGLC